MAKRAPSLKKAQGKYEREMLQAGEHIQVSLKLKAKADVDLFQALRRRFPDLTDTGIVRLAVRELSGKRNQGR